MHETSMINGDHIALNCSMGGDGGTHSTSAQCSGEQITQGNTKRCDTGSQALESGLDSLSEKVGVTIIDDPMHFDIKHMDSQ